MVNYNGNIPSSGPTHGATRAAEDLLTEQALNYVLANRFYVEIESNITACFSECSGLGVEISTEPHFEGGLNDQQRILLGQAKFNDVTLKRGMTNDLTFWDWIAKTLEEQRPERRNVNILLFNQAGETMQSWELKAAVPVKWTTPALQADANGVAIEELTLAYEGLKVSKNFQGGAIERLKQRDNSGYFS
ncbi:phage tail protein [Baaleninema sp.]|uniref:phage tail protein n=1 Tax=Baaleninema sp. TaxID=3101197 RepID=UPI003D0298B0